jgi:hypothetical protein
MKPIIVERLNVPWCSVCGADFPALARERPQDVSPPVRAGSRELVLTALVSEEGFNLSGETRAVLELGESADFRRPLQRLAKVLRLKGYKLPFTVTLKIEPVDRAAQVDAASGWVTRHDAT